MSNYKPKAEEPYMSQVPFDTLKYTKSLVEAGMDRPLAEVQAEEQVKIVANLLQDKLATKDDIKEQKGELSAKIDGANKDLCIKIDEVNQKLSAKIDEVDKRLSSQISELANQVDKLSYEMKALVGKVTIRLGGMMIASLTILIALVKLLHIG